MSSSADFEGLILTSPDAHPIPVTPARDGPDVSWLSRCRVGDNQGATGACALFAFASWAEIMFGTPISDSACLAAYEDACKRFGIPYVRGMQFSQAFQVARDHGWLRDASGLTRVHDLSELANQPILAGMSVTAAWRPENLRDGVLDHDPNIRYVDGYHAVVIVANGVILSDLKGGRYIYIENSWGLGWGHNGLGMMRADLFKRLCRELWIVTQ